MLRSAPLRRVASAPRGPSTAAEQSAVREGEGEERQAKQAFTAAAGSNSMVEGKPGSGSRILDFSVTEGSPEQMERQTEKTNRARDSG